MNEDNTFLLAQQFEEYEQQMNRADAERWHGKGVVSVVSCHALRCRVILWSQNGGFPRYWWENWNFSWGPKANPLEET